MLGHFSKKFNIFYVYLAFAILNKTNTMLILFQKAFIKNEIILHVSNHINTQTNIMLNEYILLLSKYVNILNSFIYLFFYVTVHFLI